MNICFVIGAMKFSGAEKVLSIIAKELLENNNSVSVILLEQEYSVIGDEDGIITYGAKASGNKISRLLHRWSYIRKNVKKINPDIIISFGSVCNVNMLSALLFSKLPKVVCERNDPNYDPRSKSDKFTRWFLYHFANGYVFQTNEIRDYFQKIIKDKDIAVIPNPIIDTGIRWDYAKAEKRIATVARLDNFQKDQYVMFEAFKIFHEKHPDYILDIYGNGPDETNYKKYILDNKLDKCIFLKGKINDPLNNIKTASIFLLTSKFEGMPNALMEALSIGIPCISTDCGGGGAKFLMNSCNCSDGLVEVGNASKIAKKMHSLVENKNLMNEMSSNELQINDLLEKRIIVQQWIQFFMKILEKN